MVSQYKCVCAVSGVLIALAMIYILQHANIIHLEQWQIGLQESTRYHGQGHEDKALLEKFFSKPPKYNGTFIEVGALNGVRFSNTLMFERDFQWHGILIEGSPSQFRQLVKNRPNASLYPNAVCPAGQQYAEFLDLSAVGGIKDEMSERHLTNWHMENKTTVKVNCTQLSKVVHEVGLTHIDLLSLDVEGAELMVLNTLDWSIPIHVMLIEMNQNKNEIRELLLSHHYRSTLPNWDIRDHCPKKRGCGLPNEVFVNLKWPSNNTL